MIRGLALFLMLLQHLIFDLRFFFHLPILGFTDSIVFLDVLRPVVLVFFLICSGISMRFSRNNFFHAFKLLLAASLISIFTILVDRYFNLGIAVYFNILHLLALAIFIQALIEHFFLTKLSDKGRLAFFLVELFIVSLISSIISGVRLGFDFNYFYLAFGLYINDLPYMGDYLPFFPWSIFFVIAILFAEIFYHNNKSLLSDASKNQLLKNKSCRLFLLLGRNSLLIYLLHQPIFLVFIYILEFILSFIKP